MDKIDKILSKISLTMPMREPSCLTYDSKTASYYLDKQKVKNFSSNDYLGLSKDQTITKVVAKSIIKNGVGSCGSRMMSGGLDLHLEAESCLANFFEFESAVLFSSGFLANCSIIPSLASNFDLIIFDRLCHASIIDGIKLSGAKWRTFRHKDTQNLKHIILNNKTSGNLIIITESLFSMDGDIAPLKEIESIAIQFNAILIVDESHSIGVFGTKTKPGIGICKTIGIKPDIITAGLGKAFGLCGGVVLCKQNTAKILHMSARGLIFSTSIPSAICNGIIAVTKIIKEKNNKTLEKANYFFNSLVKYATKASKTLKVRHHEDGSTVIAEIFKIPSSESQIISLICPEESMTIKLVTILKSKGFYTKGIRWPTVPQKETRIRFSICSFHTKKEILECAKAVIESLNEIDIYKQISKNIVTIE